MFILIYSHVHHMCVHEIPLLFMEMCFVEIGFNITFELNRKNQLMVASIGQMFGIVSRGFGFIINVY